MPREQRTVRLWDGVRPRECVVWVTWDDDPPGRAEAVAFFGHEMLMPDVQKLYHVLLRFDELPLDGAQAYLNAHPIQVPWKRLDLDDRATDDDLARLKYIPELEIVRVFTSQISDKGIVHLRHLRQIKTLCLCSSNVTDLCLTVIRDLVSLQSLDLQGAPNVSNQAFADTVALLPDLVDSYPPSPERPPVPIQDADELYDDWRQRVIFDPDP